MAKQGKAISLSELDRTLLRLVEEGEMTANAYEVITGKQYRLDVDAGLSQEVVSRLDKLQAKGLLPGTDRDEIAYRVRAGWTSFEDLDVLDGGVPFTALVLRFLDVRRLKGETFVSALHRQIATLEHILRVELEEMAIPRVLVPELVRLKPEIFKAIDEERVFDFPTAATCERTGLDRATVTRVFERMANSTAALEAVMDRLSILEQHRDFDPCQVSITKERPPKPGQKSAPEAGKTGAPKKRGRLPKSK
jgi:hypothetical protein